MRLCSETKVTIMDRGHIRSKKPVTHVQAFIGATWNGTQTLFPSRTWRPETPMFRLVGLNGYGTIGDTITLVGSTQQGNQSMIISLLSKLRSFKIRLQFLDRVEIVSSPIRRFILPLNHLVQRPMVQKKIIRTQLLLLAK